MKTLYAVLMTFQHPAWDEKRGIEYLIRADSKANACKYARRRADDDGHSGRRFFKAVEATEDQVRDYEFC